MKTERFDIHQHITDKIVSAIERGAGEFRLPWHRSAGNIMRPVNIASKKPYRGVNVLALWATAEEKAYTSGVWGTYRQWSEAGAQVRNGEKSAYVVFYKEITVAADGGNSEETDTLSQLLRSGRGEADPVPESGAATAPNRKSLKWNRRRRRRRPHHRAASSRCAAQAARAGRAGSAPPKAPLSQLLRSGRGEADPVPESGAAAASNRKSLKRNRRRRRRRPHHRAASSRCTAQAARAGRATSPRQILRHPRAKG